MQSAAIRQSFLDFFKARDHRIVPSSSLVPADDPSLLFTNAGMVQFKGVFQGLEARDYKRATTCQKCVRAGGKHNDLEQVGHTARHHTFFEMLGNFSFGDYFKRDAIAFAWEWVTSKQFLGIDPQRLYVTVHHTDDEARQLWRQIAGVADDRIYGLGDKDNFWQMGDTGPCGPCSEIMVDIGHRAQGAGVLTLDEFSRRCEAGELLEIWNLVFMQFDQAPDGSRKPLPAPSVDTGAGLERISAVMQGVPSNFDTDAFVPILQHASEVVGRPYDRGPAGAPFRVLADHARAVTFLLADGVFPASEGRGYVLRRILRRAVRYAWLLGRQEPTLVHLAGRVTELLGGVYPEIVAKRSHIERVTRAEEERFLETIEGGLRRLDEIKDVKVIGGDEAFRLYDTFGFPLDLTQMIATERGQRVDAEGFENALAEQRERSRAARRAGTAAVRAATAGTWVPVKTKQAQQWVGYETTRAETDVVAFRQDKGRLALILEQNPFYAESGGQVSDTGVVKGDGWELTVEDVERVEGKSAVVGSFGDTFAPTPVHALVNESRRHNIERNHTATHLVHAALRKILGTHVGQRGSVVAPDRLRFDFSSTHPVDDRTLALVEDEVNSHVLENVSIVTQQMAYKDAIKLGAMAFFEEKYGDVVRVVEVPGVSLELCGGTHVDATGTIGLFTFTHETGVAAGVRRIEALTGPGAFRHARDLERRLDEAASLLKAQPEHLARRIEALLEDNRKLERRIQDLLKKGSAGENGAAVERIGDIELHVADTDVDDRAQIGVVMDAFRSRHQRAVSVLFTSGERAGIHVAVTDDLVGQGVKAGEIANAIAAVSGGKGGGRPHYASAGAGDVSKLPQARAKAVDIVRGLLAK